MTKASERIEQEKSLAQEASELYSLRRSFYKQITGIKHTDYFKSLTAEQKKAFNNEALSIHKTIKDLEESKALLSPEEIRSQRGVLSNIVTDLTAGALDVGKSGTSLAAWSADMVGAKDTAKSLDAVASDLGEAAARISPAADPNNFADFAQQSVLRNLPLLTTTGMAGKAMTGSKLLGGLTAGARGAATGAAMAPVSLSAGAAQGLSTVSLYGIPAMRQSNVEMDDGKIREGNAFQELAMAIPYGAIETYMGVSPAKFVNAMSGATASKATASLFSQYGGKIAAFLQKPIVELSKRHGSLAAAGAMSRWIASNIVGEASEEVLQGIMEVAQPILAKMPIEQAIPLIIKNLGKTETITGLLTQAYGGGIVGGILGGAGSIRQKYDSIVTAKAKAEKEGAALEELQALVKAKIDLEAKLKALDTAKETFDARQAAIPPIPQQVAGVMQQGIAAERQKLSGLVGRLEAGIGAPGTMSDYQAYQQSKTAAPATTEADAEQMVYPSTLDGAKLMALNSAETRSESLQRVEYDPNAPENIPLLTYQPGAESGRRLPGGEEIKPGGADDIIRLKNGEPFKSSKAAQGYQTKNNLKSTHDVTPVRGGFVLMKKPVKQSARSITAETPKAAGGIKIVDKSGQVPSTKKLVAAGDASRIEKKLVKDVTLALPETAEISETSSIGKPADVTTTKSPEDMTDEEWLAGTRFYRSGKTKNAQLPNGKRVILSAQATEKTFRETSRDFLLSVRKKKSNSQPAGEKKQSFSYGLRARPLDVNTVPKGFVSHNAGLRDAARSIRHGVVAYGRKLTPEEVKQFELVDLNEDQPAAISPEPAPEVTQEKPNVSKAPEATNRKHSYSNTDITVPKAVADKMLDLGKSIPDSELYIDKDDPSYGRETRPHVTVRYGLDTDNPADLQKLSEMPPIKVRMGDVSIFETDKYDVVKVDVDGPELRAANKMVGELVSVPGETHKDYKPHATIAYVKKGEGKKYVGNKALSGQTFEIDEINLVDRDGKEHKIKLAGKPEAAKPAPVKSQAPKPAGKIEDFGEVLRGAKKHYAEAYKDKLKASESVDEAIEPLSKSWPEPDYQQMIEGGADPLDVGLVRALRDLVPNKPPKGSRKMGRYLSDLRANKAMATLILEGKRNLDQLKAFLKNDRPAQFYTKMQAQPFSEAQGLAILYATVGHKKSLKGTRVAVSRFSLYEGKEQNPPLDLFVIEQPGKSSPLSNMPRNLGRGPVLSDALSQFKGNYETAVEKSTEKPGRQTKIDVYRKTVGPNSGRFFLGHKIRATVLELKFFDTPKEAREYLQENRAELEKYIEDRKKTTTGRREENLPRTGADTRNGRNITPSEFSSTFGFRGVQFGNWVEDGKRQANINEAYDALMDLASALNIPPAALSLNGELGLAFGARGRGGEQAALAHYETDNVVINLTKKRGAGSLAHEWLHGLDNYLAKGGVGIARDIYLSNNSRLSTARAEVREAFDNLMKAIQNTGLPARSKELDSLKSKIYWSSNVEMAARSFESYILRKLDAAGIRNDFLVNTIGESKNQEENKSFPYILESEIPTVVDAFDNLFNTLKQEKTDKGVKLYSVEYLVAKYAAAGVQKAASVIREGARMFASGVTKFADWAKGMLKQFGSKIGKQLRSMYADLQAFNKQLGRTGAISGRVAGAAAKPAPLVKRSDLTWSKLDKNNYEMTFNGKPAGKLKRTAKGRWLWVEGNQLFVSATGGKSFIKDRVFEAIKATKIESAKIARVEATKAKKDQEKLVRHDDFFKSKPTTPAPPPGDKKSRFRRFIDSIITTFSDKTRRLEEVQQLAKDIKGIDLPDNQNAFERKEILSGRIAARVKYFMQDHFQPILDGLNERGISYDKFNRFLRIMHAEERNDYIDTINPEFKRRGVPGSGIATAEARAEIAAMKADGSFYKYFAMGRKFWALHDNLLDVQLKYGTIGQATYDAIKGKYKFYAPLRRIDEGNIGLNERALGQRTEKKHQLTLSKALIDATFGFGENNRKKQAFARFAINNPMPALYEMYRPDKVPYFDAAAGQVRYRVENKIDDPSIFAARFGDKTLLFKIKDAELAEALRGEKELPEGSRWKYAEKAEEYLRYMNNILGAVYTQYNIDFIPSNWMRDIQTAFAVSSIRESTDIAAEIMLGVLPAVKTAANVQLGRADKDADLYREFELQGGKMGFSDVYKLEQAARDLEKQMNDRLADGWIYNSKEAARAIANVVGGMNEVIESSTRFSGYKAARKAGLSKQKAATLAINLTVNFSKKGGAATLINSLYLFGNAGLAGVTVATRTMNAARKTKTGRALLAAAIGYGFVMDIMNRLLSDFDDEEGLSYYDKLTPQEKDAYHIFMIPGAKENVVKIPMFRNFNILPAIGRNLSAMMFGAQGLGDSVKNLYGAFVGSFNPLGADERGMLFTFTPTIGKLPLDLATNTNWTGRQIAPNQPPFSADIPNHQLFNRATSKQLVAFTKFLSDMSFGTDYKGGYLDFSPAKMQHVIENFTGGPGKTAVRVVDSVSRMLNGELPEAKNIPILRVFIGEADRGTFERFRENTGAVETWRRAVKENNAAWLRDNYWLRNAETLAKSSEKQIRDLRKANTDDEQTLRDKVVLIQKRFNKGFEAMRKGAPMPEIPMEIAVADTRKKPKYKRKKK